MDIHVKNIVKNLERGYETSERSLWKRLQARRLSGLHFKRRQLIGNCVVHFVCFEKKTVVEIRDRQRDPDEDGHLVSQGFRVLAFSNAEVEQNIERVLKVIREHCTARSPGPGGPA